MPEWIGQTIGKVRIEKFLARGGMAEVYLGTHITLVRQVAIKVLHSYIEEDPMVLERFEREARVVATLRHPNIVQIHDFDTIDGHPYIVMEYLRGPTLKTYLQHQRKTRMPHLQVARLLDRLAAALDYAHKQGVIHRDIKPGNILLHDEIPLDKPLPEDVEAVLTDFGLVRLADTSMHTTSGVISGTPEYMSPEQALGSEIDHRTDIYSVGIVLYEMLAGRVPFKADNILTVLSMQIQETPPPIPELPARVQAVLDRALQKNPQDRYQSSRELAVDFSRSVGLIAEPVKLQEPEPVPLVPAPPPIQTRAPSEHSGVTSSVFQAWRERVEREIEQSEDLPEEDKALLKQNVEQITLEAEKGKKTDTKRIERLLSMLSVRAPDIFDVALPTPTDLHVNIEGSENVVAIRGIATSFKIVLQNSRPIVTLLLGLVLIGAAIAFLYWMLLQPGRMTGDFNIAVAEFMQVGDSEPEVASILSQQVFRFLDDQAKLITFENVQVAHKNIGRITSAEEAKALAKKINAQVVIYGDVTTIGNQVRLTPQFYIAEAFRADASELNGQQRLAAPITFPIDSIVSLADDPLQLMQERAVIMTEFTKSLVYLTTENLPLSKEAIDKAIRYSEQQGPFEGQEVLYVFASQIARLQGDQVAAQNFGDEALRINPAYGRGYIAKANVFYDEGNLYQAIENYKKAKGLPDQPIGAYIIEKASLGIGNSCWVQLQYVKQTPNPDPVAVKDLEQCALDNYQQLIELYTQQQKPEMSLKEMAAWAYYGLGKISESRGQLQEAQKMYEHARQITADPDLIEQLKQAFRR